MPQPPFRPTPRYPLPPSPPPPGGPFAQVPYLFPYVERPLGLGHGQVPPQMGGSVPDYPMWRYPSGGSPEWTMKPWMDQVDRDLVDRDRDFSDETKELMYDLYKARGLDLPSKFAVTVSNRAEKTAKDMITARETARGYGNLYNAGRVGANIGVDHLNEYLTRVFNPEDLPGSFPGGTAIFPGVNMDPAAVLNMGAQHMMGGDIGILPGWNLPGRK